MRWLLTLCVAVACVVHGTAATCNCLYGYDGRGSFTHVPRGNVADFDSTAGPVPVFDRRLTTITSQNGYLEGQFVQVQFWDSADFDPTASAITEQYFARNFDAATTQQAQGDVVSAFGDVFPHNAFTAQAVDTFTYVNFTYSGGDETTPANTVQVVFIYGEVTTLSGPTTHAYVMLNIDTIEWWSNGSYPEVGITYYMDNGRAEAISYLIPGSGSVDMENTLPLGNSDIPGRWMFHVTACTTAACLQVPNSVAIVGDVYSTATGLMSSYIDCCKDGFTGDMCIYNTSTVYHDYCTPEPCVNGTCSNFQETFTCSCDPGYTGSTCAEDIDDCSNSPCIFGSCIDQVNGFFCDCEDGYTGDQCEVNVDDCGNDPCLNGCCVDLVSNYSCECYPGWAGNKCDIDVDDCDPDPCENGTCTDFVDGYNCTCDVGFSGTNCEVNIDDCYLSPCINGSCTDGIASFTCLCDEGFTGERCEINIDDCEASPCVNGYCFDDVGSYSCGCLPSYTGTNCDIFINECNNDPCENGLCQNVTVNTKCVCDPGFTGDFCNVDIDECQSSPCIHGNCEDSEVPNMYTCSCFPGYTGTRCELDINECDADPCLNGTCIDGVNSFECLLCDDCQDSLCAQAIDYCLDSSQCGSLGKCVSFGVPSKYYCDCVDGVTGRHCEVDDRPEAGTFGEWSDYSPCSKTCDKGIQMRYRQCLRVPCFGSYSEERVCSTDRCAEENVDSLLLVSSKDIKQIISEELQLKEHIAASMNDYCSLNSPECCSGFGSSTGNFDVSHFGSEDVEFVSGFPLADGPFNVQLRVRVKIPIDFQATCLSRPTDNDSGTRVRRQTSQEEDYIAISTVANALESGIGNSEEDLCCYTVADAEEISLNMAPRSLIFVLIVLVVVFASVVGVLSFFLRQITQQKNRNAKVKTTTASDRSGLQSRGTPVRYFPDYLAKHRL